MIHLNVEDVLRLHYGLVKMFEDQGDPIAPAGPRDENLLHSAVGRPLTSLGGVEKYDRVESKAAALFHSLVMNHPFHNGNKRTALVSTLVFLDNNDRRIVAVDDDVFDFVVDVAGRNSPYDGTADDVVNLIETWIKDHMQRGRTEAKGMKSGEFLEACKAAGASVRQTNKGGSWLVIAPSGKNIRFSMSTKKMDGPAIKRYLQVLGMSEGATGIHLDEFQDGLDPSQQVIRSYRTVLKRLAHT